MRYHPFTSHKFLTNYVIALLIFAICLCAYFGELKNKQDIEWLDIVGEGGIVFMALMWIAALLISRPPGKVTSYLVSGLGLFMFSGMLDLLDEWILQPTQLWLSWFESLPAPVGMLLTSLGLYYWHQEQYVLNSQLRRREAHLREHDKVCPITGVYRAEYLQEILNTHLKAKHRVLIAAIDVRNFASFNSEFGFSQGDRLLREISELLLMNCRLTDVVCRYAGDCFMVLMPATTVQQGDDLLAQIKSALTHCAFKVEGTKQAKFQHVTTYLVQSNLADTPQSLTHKLQLGLQQQKQRAIQREQLC